MSKGILLAIFTIMSATLPGQNLYAEIANSEDHTIFLELLEFTGLDHLLINDDFHSVLAPNNEAIESRYDLDELDSLKINDLDFLESLLLNHFVPDTVIVEGISDDYLPLSGSHFYLFIDGAGAVGVKSLTAPTGEPYPYLSGSFAAGDHYTDLNNGRVLWLENNIIHPNCKSPSIIDLIAVGPLANVIIQSNVIDSIWNTTTPLTFICPRTNDIYEYIDQNGGVSNTPFVDTFVRRHIINEYIPLQSVENGTIVKNLLGEDLFFSKQDGQYYLNESSGIVHFYDYKKSASITLDSFLVGSNISTIEGTDLDHVKIFPNPAKDFITIINSTQANNSSLKVYSIDGIFILIEELTGFKFDVDISNLNPGFYVIEYRSDSNVERTRLLVL